MRIIGLFLFLFAALHSQGQTPPTKEEFVNEVFFKLSDSAVSHYFLIAGTDTCRFEKFDYDEWVKYHLQEDVPLVTLNELAYNVHTGHTPYFWKTDKLQGATSITIPQADSLFQSRDMGKIVYSFSPPFLTEDGKYAVIDINYKDCPVCGAGFTFLFRHTAEGWRRIGFKQNWGVRQ